MLLSPEVVSHIFSFLEADISDLKRCSQAHPLLSRLAERHLYRRTTVDITSGGDVDITGLSKQLSENPHIRNYVRILTIKFEPSLPAPTTMMETASSILSSLPCLNAVTLAGSTPFAQKPWYEFHKSFLSVFVDILHQPDVREVHLEGLSGFPLSVFDTCQNIKTLSLCNCGTFTKSDLTTPCPALESLSIRLSDDSTLFSWAIDRISHLTCLKFRPQGDEFSAFPKVLEACSTSLTSLELDTHNLCAYSNTR